MKKWNLFEYDASERAVRLGIGVSLLVAITVGLAAVVGTFVVGLGDQVSSTGAPQAAGEKIGLAAGGAADATAFRNNVREGYVPQPTDMTAEGLFHDYYFDTGQTRSCEAMFCPSYSRAVTTGTQPARVK